MAGAAGAVVWRQAPFCYIETFAEPGWLEQTEQSSRERADADFQIPIEQNSSMPGPFDLLFDRLRRELGCGIIQTWIHHALTLRSDYHR